MVLIRGILNKIKILAVIMLLLATVAGATHAAQKQTHSGLVDWKPWSQDVFNRAKQQNKFILLDLEAVWCHWCHVMDQTTYATPAVAAMIKKHFIAVKVDHDARPDLAQRYRDYGWPATIVFASDGTEIVKRAGFIKPDNFVRLLQAIVNDPSPETQINHNRPKQFSTSSLLPESLAKELNKRRKATYDKKLGGYKNGLKFLDQAYIEYAITQAQNGDQNEENVAKTTLDSALALVDPVWGGAYQYSTYDDWQHPHFEKIMTTQARYIKLYTNAYAHWKKPEYLAAAQQVAQYLTEFLLDDNGAFYTSQDADLVQGSKGHNFFKLDRTAREKKGMPRIDKNQYAQENGWAIEAFAALFEATGQREYLKQAKTAALWVIKHRAIKHRSLNDVTNNDSGFTHGESKNSKDVSYYLGDNLAMANAFVQLYRADADRRWLDKAVETTLFIHARFRNHDAGFKSATSTNSPVPPATHIDENIAVVRLNNLLYHYTGKQTFKTMAEHAMRWLVTPAIALERIEESGILLAAYELANAPSHLTVVGHKDNKHAQALFATALRSPAHYKRIEWWDTREGDLPNTDIQYPVLSQPAAFICNNGRCSTPAFDSDTYRKSIERLSRE
jgi:uncharacterized protein